MFEEDLQEVFSEDEHAVPIEFGGKTFSGIFNNEYLDQEGGSVDVESSTPVLVVESKYVRHANHGDKMNIDGNDMYIAGIQPDGTGITNIVLKKHD